MLLEQAKDLTAKIGDYGSLKSNAGAIKDLETRATSFAKVADSLKATRSAMDRLKAAGVAVDFGPNDAAVLAGKATSLRDLLKRDLAHLNDPPFNIKYDFIDRVTGLCDAANKAALAGWQRRIALASEMASDEVLAALGAVPQYRPVIASIAALKRQVATLGSSVPVDVEAGLAELAHIVRSYASAWNEMIGDGIPASVVAFLRATAGAGAPLGQLTEEVESWLEARGLLTLFRIKIQANPT